MSLRTATIDVETRDGVADALLVAPDDGRPRPGVLLYMDAFGPRPRLEEMAGHLAEQGYVVLVPHVFYRSGPAPLVDSADLAALADPEARERVFAQLRPLMADLTPDRATSDAEAYLDLLTAQEQVADGPVGVVGYCMGGALALRTAAHRPAQVAAAAAFHPARLATDAEDSPHLLAPRLQAAVYVGSADDDPGMPPEQQQ